MSAEAPPLDFRCSQCETTEKDFSFQKRPQEDCFRIVVRNLPLGLTREGIRNLFLTVGSPLECVCSPARRYAFVVFKSMNEAELAYRDLHHKPPYNLKIIRDYKHFDGDVNNVNKPQVKVDSKGSDSWDFSPEESPVECRPEDDGEKMRELIIQVRSVVESLGYDPSIRMRQKVLDCKTGSDCVSKGRGYVNMGKGDRFVGGLQKYMFSSGNGKAKDMMSFRCENCDSTTTKFCSKCHASYCSLSCLKESSTNHLECSNPSGDDEVKDAAVNHPSDSRGSEDGPGSSINSGFPEVTFTSGCTVLMSSYSSMQTVFLRRIDEGWDDRFAKLCNDVALEAIKGERLQQPPEKGEVVAAKYYEDLCFYRAGVLSKANTKISVLFIDFGNTQETLLEDLKPLPEPLRSVAVQVLQVHLKDVSEDSSLDSVEYYNALTARRVPLMLKFVSSTDEVVLVENDSNMEVNKTVIEKALPSWKKDDFNFSKLGENYYLESLSRTKLEVSKTCTVIISHFDENEFRESEVFWVTLPYTDEYIHVKTRMRQGMTEYCNFRKDDVYLPRVNEVCLAKENDEWHRCVNLQNHKTTCCLFFIDDGHSSFIETKNIRKMVQDFTEVPSQAVCCVLPGDSKMTPEKELSKVIKYLKESVGQRIDSVSVLKLVGDGYCLSFPRIREILTHIEP